MKIVRDNGEDNTSKPEKVEFDPKKVYTWNPEDRFVLNGNQFGQILNTLRVVLASKEIQMLITASDTMEDILADAVEKGVAKEVVEPLKE